MQAVLRDKLVEISESVEPVIRELLTKNVDSVNNEAIFYQIAVGGKRLRPALVVLSGQLFGGDYQGLLYPAASVEILHNSTLIIDDIIDHADFRRDKPSTWKQYGSSIAQCLTFDYVSSIFAGINHINNSQRLVDLYSNTLKTIIDGEIKDILFERNGREDEDFVVKNRYETITKKDYFEMISQKTAILLQASCQAGAIYASASDDQINSIGEFGYNIGIAFQIRDDILDIFGDEKEFGKKIGKDIVEKKMSNYVILNAIEQLSPDDKKTVVELFEGSNPITDDGVKSVTSLIEKTDARRIAEHDATIYVQNAILTMDRLPKNEFSERLIEIANYIIDRSK
jgi:geranylgeranyl diphosphate synthase, type I